MSRVSILVRPEPGHIVPTLRLATFLRDRGHHVCYLTVSQYQAFFDRLGFECVALPVPREDARDRDVEDIWSPPANGLTLKRSLEAGVVAQGSSWAGFFAGSLARSTPDLVICDSSIATPAGAAIARSIGRPLVSVAPLLPSEPQSYLPELVLCPFEFTMPEESALRQRGRYFCEPSVWHDETRRRPEGLEAVLNDDRPLVFCSLGTQSTAYGAAGMVLRAVIEAFEDLPSHQLLIAASGLYDGLAQEPRPANVRVVPSVPQLSVLERAAVIITHGGMGTLKEAIMAKVPSIVIPFAYDQPANARRVEYHGIGRACPPSSCTRDHIRELVLEVSDHSTTFHRLANLSAIFRRHESECRAGTLLLQALSGAPLTRD